MEIDAYADWARGVGLQPEPGRLDRERLAYLALGLVGEAGEVSEHVKKLLRDGRWDPERVADELGDVVYYWSRLCIAAGRKPSEVLAASVAKIEARIRDA